MNKFIKEEKLWEKGTDITNCLMAHVLNNEPCLYDKDPGEKFFNINEGGVATDKDELHGKNATIAPRIIPQFFNIIGKGKTRREQFKSIIKQEEEYLIQLFVAASDTNGVQSYKEFTVTAIEKLMYMVEWHNYVVRKILMNKKYMPNCSIKDIMLKLVYNARLIFDKRFKNCCFAMPEPEFVGVRSLSHFGISNKKGSKGKLYCYEALSIIYPKAIACVNITPSQKDGV